MYTLKSKCISLKPIKSLFRRNSASLETLNIDSVCRGT